MFLWIGVGSWALLHLICGWRMLKGQNFLENRSTSFGNDKGRERSNVNKRVRENVSVAVKALIMTVVQWEEGVLRLLLLRDDNVVAFSEVEDPFLGGMEFDECEDDEDKVLHSWKTSSVSFFTPAFFDFWEKDTVGEVI